eukprot:2256862-Amphidinium_carterae.1
MICQSIRTVSTTMLRQDSRRYVVCRSSMSSLAEAYDPMRVRARLKNWGAPLKADTCGHSYYEGRLFKMQDI